jgi:hypothetical protein
MKMNGKKRECPAVGRTIDAAECGGNRASRYSCPVTCPFYPWSPENYDMALKIDSRVSEKVISRLALEPHGGDDLKILRNEFDIQKFFINKIFRNTNPDGTTFFERWEAQQFAGLNNDEIFFLKAQSKIRALLFDVVETKTRVKKSA